jgi:hypothetical protein
MRRLLPLWLLLASPALADIISPIEAECRNKKAGDACRAELGQGVCAPAKCTRNDYSEGPPPKQEVVDCLKCADPAPAPDAGAPVPLKKQTPKKK